MSDIAPNRNRRSLTAPQQEAIAVVDAFAASSSSGDWSGFTRDSLIDSLKDRIANPENISNAQTMLCGPAAYAYLLATEHPVSYAHAVLDLWMRDLIHWACLLSCKIPRPFRPLEEVTG